MAVLRGIADADLQLAIDCRMLDRRSWLGTAPQSEGARRIGYFDKLLGPPKDPSAEEG